MDFAQKEGPRAKKRRFFNESSNSRAQKRSSSNTTPSASASDEAPASTSSIDGPGRQDEPITGEELSVEDGFQAPPFDRETFESFVGEKVSPDLLEQLREAAGNDMERAVNLYFDKSHISSSLASRPLASGSSLAQQAEYQKISPRQVMPESRYIGAFGVGGWATKSGTSLIKHDEIVRIDRQKIQPPKLTRPTGRGRPATVQAAPKLSNAAAKRVDVIVRFTNSKGQEIGRFPKEVASWVSVLIDQKICKFEGKCIYAPERVRTNDTIFLQLRCSLLKSAFDNQAFKPSDENRASGMFEEKETAEEKELRLRQFALVKLFEEVKLFPSHSHSDGSISKQARQSLIKVGEMAEEELKKSLQPDGSSPSSDEAEDGKELEQDQLDTLYQKVKSFNFNTPEAEPPDTFIMELRPYQKQALHWMMSKEKDEQERGGSMHPLWEEYTWPNKDMDGNDCSNHIVPGSGKYDRFYVNPYSGEVSLTFPVQDQRCLGGILADEMGLGKTIEMLSLIHSHRSDVSLQGAGSAISLVNSLPRLPSTSSAVLRAPCTTLIIAPMSLLAQWQSEAEKASKEGAIRSIVYHGNDKTANLQALCCEANAASAPHIIITSYGVVLSEFTQLAANNGDRKNYGGLFSLSFFRICLDEAHHIKNRSSKTARACYELSAEHRWVLTGTPISNRLEDLFSLVHFLRVDPWSNFSFWKTFISTPFESKDFMRALDVVQTVLESLVLRRTKDMKTPTGESLVPLPPKDVAIVPIILSESEREVYDHVFTRAKRTFAQNMEAGTVMKAYTSIFAQILRLRQACCHPVLTRNQALVADEEDAKEIADATSGLADDMDLQNLIARFTADSESTDTNAFGAHAMEQIRDEAANECPICTEEPMIEQTVTGCWHSACKKCVLNYIAHQTDKGELPRCFNCRAAINQRDIFEVVREEDEEVQEGSQKVSLKRLGPHSSAKVMALTKSLKEIRKSSPVTKSVVFSQFTSFLDIIQKELDKSNIPHLRLDGSMAQKARATVLTEFAARPKGVVLLLSLRAGGVGLNLTEASRVFMMDPWWNYAVEAQAIDRVHRMGQTADVQVSRFIVENSVEERMLKVQDRKKFLAGSLGMMGEEEKKLQRIEDIKELLS